MIDIEDHMRKRAAMKNSVFYFWINPFARVIKSVAKLIIYMHIYKMDGMSKSE